MQRGFVDGGLDQCRIPRPGALARQNGLRHAGGLLGGGGGDVVVCSQAGQARGGPAMGTHIGQRGTGHTGLLQQLVHGIALARQRGRFRIARHGHGGIALQPGGGVHAGGLQRLGQRGQAGDGEGFRYVSRGYGVCAMRCRGLGLQIDFGDQGSQPVPPAAGGRVAGLHRRQRQAVLGARHGHVEHVQLLAAAGLLLGGQGGLGTGGRVGFAGQKDEGRGRGLLAGPVHQHAHGFGLLRAGVGVQQQHAIGLQPLGPVHRQQSDGLRIGPAGGAHSALLHGAHKRIGREVAAPVVLQRSGQQRTQVGLHGLALGDGRGGGKAGQHVAVLVDGVQRIVRRQALHPALVLKQNRPQRL